MTDAKSNAEILRNANVRLCRLRIWSNYKGLGFHLSECPRPPHVITLVESNSPASAGGLKISDVLLVINNKVVTKEAYNQVTIILKAAQDQHDFVELLVVQQRFYKILKKNNIIIDSCSATVRHTPIRMPNDYLNFPKHIPRTCHICLRSNDTQFGFDVVNGNNDIGVYIQTVYPGSRASSSGLRKCDRIIEIDDRYVDEDMSRDIWDKLGKALIKRTLKLLVVDTETYEYYVLNNLDFNKDNTSHVNKIILQEKPPVALVHRTRHGSEPLPSNRSGQSMLSPSTHEYISLHNNQPSNTKMTTPRGNNRNYHEELRSLDHSINQDKSPVSHQKGGSNSQDNTEHDYETEEITAEYEFPDDNHSPIPSLVSNTTTSSTAYTTHACNTVPFSSNHQTNATTKVRIDETDYLKVSSMTLDLDHKQTKNDRNVIKDGECCKTDQRFFDVENEPLAVFLPIEGYEDTPVLSLNIAIENLEQIVPKVRRNAWIAIERSTNPSDGLTPDESASIQLYTMDWKPSYQSLSSKLNGALRTDDRDQLTPYFPYFKLILTALWKLTSIKTRIWRGIRADLGTQYPVGKVFVWWGFSSCIESRDLLESDKYLGKTGVRTLFNIECQTGKSIHSHSYYQHDNEILLLPGTQFQVIDQRKIHHDVHIIYLKEIKPEYSLLQSPFDMDYSFISPITNENGLFQDSIENQKEDSSISFSEQTLTVNNMYLIVNELQSNKYWCEICLHQTHLTKEHIKILMNALESNSLITSLDLSSNNLDDNAVSCLAYALKTNKYLKSIDLNDNKITEFAVRSLADILLVNKTLLSLNLSSNPIGNNGMISIIRVLGKNIFSKSFYSNRIKLADKDDQEMAISRANITLVELYLDSIDITIDGIRELTKMIRVNNTLTHLSFKTNKMNDDSMILILDGLQQNNTLTHLYLNHNKLTDQCISSVVDVFKTNKTLKYLHLYENQFTQQGKLRLNEIAEINSFEFL